jgi:hypothetical protein
MCFPAESPLSNLPPELPSFHGVSRKNLLAWPATQMQPGGGIVDTGNQQAVDGDNQRARWLTYMRSKGLLWKEPGYKVAWNERVCLYVKL